jgi:predicted alpha/beta-fold hydrolase
MPVVESSSYAAPLWCRNAHVNTLYPRSFRRVDGVIYERERMETADGDFMDQDWSRVGAKRLAVLLHGLESSSRALYMMGLTRALNRRGWDAVCVNCRGCGGALNRLFRSYHAGASGDVAEVLITSRPRKTAGLLPPADSAWGGTCC